jgi:hypothetical protein
MRIARLPLALVPLALVTSFAGCKSRGHGIIGRAQAASTDARQAELATARALGAIGGSDDEEDARAPGQGGRRWRDTGVYVDGKPVGVLSFGELPVGLKPVWVEERHSAEIEPGSRSPGFVMGKERRYRFTDYLKAVGVDLRKVKQIQVMGPKLTEVIIASGAELRSKKASEFMFRFGGVVGGKPIPHTPPDFGNGFKPDKIAAVMVYIDKKPPVLVEDEGLELDGQPVNGVPYYGEPMRGGVRVYVDDRLALQIKKTTLHAAKPVATIDGLKRYGLLALLAEHGVDTSKMVEGWLIVSERRTRKLTRAELGEVTVAMGDKHKNEVMIGHEKVDAQAVALHAHALRPDELPQIQPGEEGE